MDANAVVQKASEAAFGRALVTNVHRAMLVEAMVAMALEPEWQWCGADWGVCDFQHPDGTRLEVKQSAARQSWHGDGALPSRCQFDIAPRKMEWSATEGWVPTNKRPAHIYVLALNPIADATADHREPAQWQFFVIREDHLPPNKTISAKVAAGLSTPAPFASLLGVVERVRASRF